MLRNTHEISIGEMNWEKANKIISVLVEEGYAVLVTIEERLIIINYTYAADYDNPMADRNKVVFMSEDSYWDMRDEEMKEARLEDSM